MFNFGTSNVTNCKEKEISFPLLILSLESKKRRGCETLPLQLLMYYLLLFTLLSKVRIDFDKCRYCKGNGTEEHDENKEGVIA